MSQQKMTEMFQRKKSSEWGYNASTGRLSLQTWLSQMRHSNQGLCNVKCLEARVLT